MAKNTKYGRPRLYNSPDDLYAVGEAYLTQRRIEGKPISVTGLAHALGLSSRASLDAYEARAEYADCVRRLKLACEMYYEDYLTSGNNATGAIFALKNFGWRDRHDIDHGGGINLSLADAIEAGRRAVMQLDADDHGNKADTPDEHTGQS